MSWMNAVKGAIFEDVPTTPPAQTVPAPTAVPAGGTVPAASSAGDPEMVASLKLATLARKTAYTALLEAADKLVNVIPDNTTRIKAAYAMVSGEQRNVDSIVKALDIHINDVDSEKLRFTQQAREQYATGVESVRTQASNITTRNEQLQQQIADLNQQVAANNAEIAKLTQQAAARQQELDASAARFAESATLVRAELEQQRVSLSSILS